MLQAVLTAEKTISSFSRPWKLSTPALRAHLPGAVYNLQSRCLRFPALLQPLCGASSLDSGYEALWPRVLRSLKRSTSCLFPDEHQQAGHVTHATGELPSSTYRQDRASATYAWRPCNDFSTMSSATVPAQLSTSLLYYAQP